MARGEKTKKQHAEGQNTLDKETLRRQNARAWPTRHVMGKTGRDYHKLALAMTQPTTQKTFHDHISD